MSIYVTTLVWKFSKADGSTLLTALAIADFADDEGRAYPSIKTLAKKARASERTVQYALASLKDFGELVIEPGTGPKGTNTYHLQVNALRGAVSAGGVQNTTEGGATHCTQTVIEPSSPSEKKKKAPTDAVIKPAEWISDESWLRFVEHRKAKRAKLTPGAVSILLKTLAKAKDMGLDPDELLDKSVANGWSGVFLPQGGAIPAARPPFAPQQKADKRDEWLNGGRSDRQQGDSNVIDVVATPIQ